MKNKTLENNYIDYYISGYLNFYNVSLWQSGLEKNEYKKHKIKTMLMYLGIDSKFQRFFELLSPMYLPVEFIFSVICISIKILISLIETLLTKKNYPKNQILMLALRMPQFRINNMMRCLPKEEEIKAVKIPFLKSETSYERYSMYSGLTCSDCLKAGKLSFQVLLKQMKEYQQYDFLFRSYSSFEFFLSCIYVTNSDKTNRYLYYSTTDRWAYLMGNDENHHNIFIQHGIIGGEPFKYVNYKAPSIAYYINDEQKEFFENVIYIGKPKESYFRPHLMYTANEKLRVNERANLLVICCNRFLDIEKRIIPELAKKEKYNIYIKPHPGFKDHSEYFSMSKEYDLVLLEKEEYPHVDAVISYDSTLASEYEDNGIKVLRYNDGDFNEKFERILE